MRADADNVADVLAAIDSRPATLRSIALRTGLPRRRVEEAIESIRKRGLAPVCSGPDGVWLARDVASYAANVDARRRLVRRLSTPGQVSLW